MGDIQDECGCERPKGFRVFSMRRPCLAVSKGTLPVFDGQIKATFRHPRLVNDLNQASLVPAMILYCDWVYIGMLRPSHVRGRSGCLRCK